MAQKAAKKKAGTQSPQAQKTIEVDADVLRRVQNTILLRERIHYGRSTGKGLGQFLANFVAGVMDPLTGLEQGFGFIEGVGGGLRDGVQTSRLIYIDARHSSSVKNVEHMQKKLDKLKAKGNKAQETFMSDEELASIEPELAEALATATTPA